MAQNKHDWATWADCYTSSTHDVIARTAVKQQVSAIASVGSVAKLRGLKKALEPLTSRGATVEKLEQIAALPEGERDAAIDALVAAMSDKAGLVAKAMQDVWDSPEMRQAGGQQVAVSHAISNVSIDGDRAVVTMTVNVSGSSSQHQALLEKTPQGWKIDDRQTYETLYGS
jgi:hypothetical protein